MYFISRAAWRLERMLQWILMVVEETKIAVEMVNVQ